MGLEGMPVPKGQGFSRVGWVGFAAEQGLCGRWRCSGRWEMCFRVDLLTAARVLFAFRLKLYHGTPRALLHPRFQDPVESKQQPNMASQSLLGGFSYPNVCCVSA